jgi:3-oxoacyl-[acyl-carrier protein] reductase
MNTPHELDGRIALITGGSRGIGFAAARGLGQLGATVVLVGQDLERAQRSAQILQQEDIDAVGFGCDVSDPVQVASLKQALGPLADIDICVLAAGVMAERMTKTLRTTPKEWRRVMGINLDGAFYVLQAFGPGMAERRWGRIVTVSACLGRFTGPGLMGGLAPYRVSKAGLNALTRNLAAEMQFGKRGVLVDAMCPNHCRTDMGGSDAPRSPEEGADTIIWLASRDSDSETGLLWEDRQVVPW